ncbi:MAG: fluoride efflux transporter CrcB [Planctomycetota bacterium]|nr:fluoride efflux transporter CrcB [Planctomycetota bacterium]MDA1214470.1 fluoride efflux transporter CrcB [Planctomycetota bacterium]
MIPNWLAVGLGGFIGAVLRYAVAGLMQRRFAMFLPAGTLAVNVIGCFVIGLAMTWFSGRGEHLSTWRFFLVTGILGGFTTFSAFGYEFVALLHNGDMRSATWTILAHLVLCIAGVELGRIFAQRLFVSPGF